MSEERKWYLPVGLYPDQMEGLQELQQKLRYLVVSENTRGMRALRDVLYYFSRPNYASGRVAEGN